MVIVSDTSVISNLLQIELADILHRLFERVVIPPSVYEELARNDEIRGQLDDLDFITVRSIHNTAAYDHLLIRLDPGESEAIVLAEELSADLLLMDERRGRAVAKERGLRVIGLLGILLEAKQQKFIPQLTPYLERLVGDVGFRINDGLYQYVLDQAGE